MFGFKPHTKKIGLFTAISFAVGAMIGGGVFVLSGTALQKTGPSALLSFVVAGVIVLLSAISFAAIAAQADQKESGYAAVGKLLGSPAWGFLTSWCFYIGGIIGAAFVLNAFGIYMHDFVSSQHTVLTWSLFAAGLLTLVNLGPASAIGRIEGILVVGKIVILLLLIFVGATHFHSADLHPFLSHGTSGVFTASSYLFIAFLGFNVITSISGDIDNPRKTIPRAILLSMFIVTIVYVGVVIALLSANIHTYNEASVGQAAQNLIGPIGGGLVVVGALIATLSAANSNILGSSEIMVRLAVRKQVPTIFGRLTNGHPYISVLFGALFYIILLMTRQTEAIIHLANFTAIIALVIVNIAAIRLFRTKKVIRLIPILGILGAAGQLVFLPKVVILIGSFLIIVGMGVYTVRKKYFIPHLHSKLETTIKRQKGPLGRALKHR